MSIWKWLFSSNEDGKQATAMHYRKQTFLNMKEASGLCWRSGYIKQATDLMVIDPDNLDGLSAWADKYSYLPCVHIINRTVSYRRGEPGAVMPQHIVA